MATVFVSLSVQNKTEIKIILGNTLMLKKISVRVYLYCKGTAHGWFLLSTLVQQLSGLHVKNKRWRTDRVTVTDQVFT